MLSHTDIYKYVDSIVCFSISFIFLYTSSLMILSAHIHIYTIPSKHHTNTNNASHWNLTDRNSPTCTSLAHKMNIIIIIWNDFSSFVPFFCSLLIAVISIYYRTVDRLWSITEDLNILYKENWTRLAAQEVQLFQVRQNENSTLNTNRQYTYKNTSFAIISFLLVVVCALSFALPIDGGWRSRQ